MSRKKNTWNGLNQNSDRPPEHLSGDWLTLWSLIVAGWQLAKVPLCLLICCSSAFGASLSPGVSGRTVLLVSSGVLLLAMGGATLNSFQERYVDLRMKRTSGRPLVRNLIPTHFAVIQAVCLISGGIFLLASPGNSLLVPTLGGFALCIYNGIYTRLKQHTVLAILPGAACGALPPVIGWIGGGGQPLSYMSLLLFTLLFLWQVPHFCLILLRHSKDYLQVEQPSFLKLLSEKGVRRLSTVWCCGLALVMMLFSITAAPVWQWQKILLVINAVVLASMSVYALQITNFFSYRTVFILLNIQLFNHMAILASAFILA